MVHFIPEKLNRMPKSKGAHIFHKLRVTSKYYVPQG